MSIDVNEIEKYIFDPQNPKQCKTYKLLLEILKKTRQTAYISSEFMLYFLRDTILSQGFDERIWDKPDNYDALSFEDKLKLFVDQQSENDLYEYTDNLKIDKESFIGNKLFLHYIEIANAINPYYIEQCHSEYIKFKIKNKYPTSYIYPRTDKLDLSFYNKIFFTNTAQDLITCKNICQMACVVVTTDLNIFYSDTNQKVIHPNINKHIRPIFLKKADDLKILLNILLNDLRLGFSSNENLPTENISTIQNISIGDFFSINSLSMENIADKKEIYILGENGDGKTLFLQALALGLKGVDKGDMFDFIGTQKFDINIEDSTGKTYKTTDEKKLAESYKYLFAYGANRNNFCQKKEDETGYLTLFNPCFDLKNPVEWLKYLDYSEKSGKTNIMTAEKAKAMLVEILNRDVEIDISPDDVIFKEKGSKVSFDQLSAGYKSVISIVVDLLVRLSEKQPYICDTKDFQGIVLIDEVELHLHPKWKYSFVKKLRDIFPKIQFFFTTHSPTVILGASKDAVFYKIYKDDGHIFISGQIKNNGYTNNTLISSPLFDLETIASENYQGATSDDDFVYEKIHKVIAKKIKESPEIPEEEILKLIEDELGK